MRFERGKQQPSNWSVDATKVYVVDKGKLKVRTLDIAPLRETPPQKRSGMAHALKGSHSFTCTLTRSPAMENCRTCICLPRRRRRRRGNSGSDK